MKTKIITFITDFGDEFALSQLQAVALSINPKVKLITISNQITPYSINEGAFVISQAKQFFPSGTIFVGVVDPGVGTNREGIIIQTSQYTFIGPNNGLFYEAVKDCQFKVFKIIEKKVNKSHSTTFHGRDVFAKLAAFLSTNKKIADFAEQIDQERLIKLTLKPNQILHIDDYGNLKVNNFCDNFKLGDQLTIKTHDQSIKVPFVQTFGQVKPGELLAYKGSHNTLEIAKNLDSINQVLNLKVGDIISIERL